MRGFAFSLRQSFIVIASRSEAIHGFSARDRAGVFSFSLRLQRKGYKRNRLKGRATPP